MTILALVVVLCLALISLSATSTRQSSMESARQEAQANARLALSMALGELQRELGDDRRITADSDLLLNGDEGLAGIPGVWDSWVPPQVWDPLNLRAPNYIQTS